MDFENKAEMDADLQAELQAEAAYAAWLEGAKGGKCPPGWNGEEESDDCYPASEEIDDD